jgi:glycosyltransferase involved in cell wall biosynthesis
MCLNVLHLQLQNKKDIEVIVVDNGSSDGSQFLAKEKYNFKSLQFTKDKNPYKARNFGVDQSKGNNLVFLDAKCIPFSNYINELERLVQLDQWDLVAGEFEFINLSSNSTISELAYAVTHLRTNPIYNGGEISALTGNMMVKREVFFELGKFDENRSGSDIRFSQLSESKNKIKIFAPNLKVGYHAKKYADMIHSIKRVAKGAPFKMPITGVRPAGKKYIETRLENLNIKITWIQKTKLQFFIMYLRMLKYMYQFR